MDTGTRIEQGIPQSRFTIVEIGPQISLADKYYAQHPGADIIFVEEHYLQHPVNIDKHPQARFVNEDAFTFFEREDNPFIPIDGLDAVIAQNVFTSSRPVDNPRITRESEQFFKFVFERLKPEGEFIIEETHLLKSSRFIQHYRNQLEGLGYDVLITQNPDEIYYPGTSTNRESFQIRAKKPLGK